MARPEEKAQAMMNKWTTMKESYDEGIGRAGKKKRPYLASLCETLYESGTSAFVTISCKYLY